MTSDSGRLPKGEDAQAAECEASQSGAEGNRPNSSRVANQPEAVTPTVTDEGTVRAVMEAVSYEKWYPSLRSRAEAAITAMRQANTTNEGAGDLLLIWQKGFNTPLVGRKDGAHYVLCGSPYGDSILTAEDVERTEHIYTAMRQAHTVAPADEDAELARRFAEMLFHADALSLKPTASNQVETTQITTDESKQLQQLLGRIAERLERSAAK